MEYALLSDNEKIVWKSHLVRRGALTPDIVEILHQGSPKERFDALLKGRSDTWEALRNREPDDCARGVFRWIKDVSKTLSAWPRHPHNQADCVKHPEFCMDSGGWVYASISIEMLQKRFRNLQINADAWQLILLVVVAKGGNKGRFHACVTYTRRSRHPLLKFMRASQGHSVRFVQEDRMTSKMSTLPMLLDSVRALWHGTRTEWLNSVMDVGLVPGGLNQSRNAVHLSPVHPWIGDITRTMRSRVNVFIAIDPRGLLKEEGFKYFTFIWGRMEYLRPWISIINNLKI